MGTFPDGETYRKSDQQAGLANVGVADEDHLEQVVVFSLHLSLRAKFVLRLLCCVQEFSALSF